MGQLSKAKRRVERRDGARCAFCGAEGYLTVDHVVPRDCGGASDDGNLQLLCYPCNQWKSNRPVSREDFHRARANRELQREGYFKHRARMIRFAKEMLRAAEER
jgi:5-methylcytosine-specific restriction endonuclease McrA